MHHIPLSPYYDKAVVDLLWFKMAKRTEKLARQLQKDLGEILDSAARQLLNGAMVTVLEVKVTPDLGLAKVYLSLFQSQNREEDLELLKEKYTVTKSQSVDMFPQTHHIENVVLLKLKWNKNEVDSDSFITNWFTNI